MTAKETHSEERRDEEIEQNEHIHVCSFLDGAPDNVDDFEQRRELLEKFQHTEKTEGSEDGELGVAAESQFDERNENDEEVEVIEAGLREKPRTESEDFENDLDDEDDGEDKIRVTSKGFLCVTCPVVIGSKNHNF